MKTGKQRIDLTEGPIVQGLVRFAIPILLGTIVTQLYNVADSMIVGRFVSADALAAVSAGGPVMSLINLFMIGLSAGSNVVIAQRMGARDMDALQKAVSTISFLTLSCSLFITIVGLCVTQPLLLLLGTPEEIFPDSRVYLIIVYLGTTGNMVYQMGSGVLRGMGDSSWPFYFLLLCSLLNIVLNLLAVLVLSWGVAGVAAATAAAQLVSGIGVLLRLNKGGYG
ncbi:MAG: polysaccharide biosynthesis C-terminal domain-containing protein, partial [Clostridia bacterium]|nr:polysaccharide biosynthesis C-terminal domain-containing protein [Clostridia bacterium]